jgi:enterochelin esterase family protein
MTGVERKVWTQPAVTGSPQALILFLDAELYIERVQAPEIVQRLAPQALSVFVSNNGAAARHADYTCNPDYAQFIAEEIIPWVLQVHPTLDPAKVVLAGLSLSGLAAADIAMRDPQRFAAVICQSPSFWWENERFCTHIPRKASPALPIWLCVGDQETQRGVTHPPTGLRQDSTQIEACEHARDEFLRQGYTVHYRTYSGGHNPVCWQADLELALPWACAFNSD